MIKLVCSNLCLFSAIVELHAMAEKLFNDYLIGKWKWILFVIRAYFVVIYI